MNTKKTGSTLHDRLEQLINSGNAPTITVSVGSQCMRVQERLDATGTEYKNPYHFSTAIPATGRYNDPDGKLGVCYVAQTATVALAETFGRKRDNEDEEPLFIDGKELDKKIIATLEFTRELVLLDIGKALCALGLTIDVISGADYQKAQDIVRFFSKKPQYRTISGIAYISRHHADGYCFAIWQNNESEDIFREVSRIAIKSFDTEKELPSFWSSSTIDGEEILTDVLGFSVT